MALPTLLRVDGLLPQQWTLISHCHLHINSHDRTAVEVFSRQTLAYDDEGSSDSEHDAYQATIIAEGEEKNSEDGKTHLIPRENKEKQCWNVFRRAVYP